MGKFKSNEENNLNNNQEKFESENVEDNVEDETNVKPENKKITILNFMLIIVIFVGLFIYMITVDGIDNIISVLNKVDYRWVLVGVGCLIIQLLFHLVDNLCKLMSLLKPEKE